MEVTDPLDLVLLLILCITAALLCLIHLSKCAESVVRRIIEELKDDKE